MTHTHTQWHTQWHTHTHTHTQWHTHTHNDTHTQTHTHRHTHIHRHTHTGDPNTAALDLHLSHVFTIFDMKEIKLLNCSHGPSKIQPSSQPFFTAFERQKASKL